MHIHTAFAALVGLLRMRCCRKCHLPASSRRNSASCFLNTKQDMTPLNMLPVSPIHQQYWPSSHQVAFHHIKRDVRCPNTASFNSHSGSVSFDGNWLQGCNGSAFRYTSSDFRSSKSMKPLIFRAAGHPLPSSTINWRAKFELHFES